MGANIPLPALDIRAPQPGPSPLQQIAAIGQIKAQRQQAQMNNIEMQQQQQALDSQKAIQRAFSDANGDPDKTSALAAQYGARPQDVMALKQSSMAMQKSLQDLDAGKRKQLEDHISMADDFAKRVLTADPDAQPAVYAAERQKLIQSGQFKPEELPEQYNGPEFMKLHAAAANAVKIQLAAAKEATAKASTAESESQIKAKDAVMGTTAQQEAKANWVRQRLAQNLPVSPEDMAAAQAFIQGQQKVSTMMSPYGLKSSTISGPLSLGGRGASQSGLGGSSSQSGRTMIDAIGTGQLPVGQMARVLATDPALVEAVIAKYPNFNPTKVAGYADTYKKFTSGPIADQMAAGDIALTHLLDLKKINDDNPVEVRIKGTKAYNAYHNLLDTVTGELMTFYHEPQTNESRAKKQETLGAFFNRDSAIEEQAQAMGKRFDELSNIWENAKPSSDFSTPMPGFSRQGMEARAKLDPNYKMPEQAQAQGQPAVQHKVGDVVTIKGKPVRITAIGPDGQMQGVPAQ